ncbi:MAG TPA: hypothetical protein VL172_22830 [Kofleriaceae bacterium]|nr:hypothetical protein [Kofleriaceae bacterium]
MNRGDCNGRARRQLRAAGLGREPAGIRRHAASPDVTRRTCATISFMMRRRPETVALLAMIACSGSGTHDPTAPSPGRQDAAVAGPVPPSVDASPPPQNECSTDDGLRAVYAKATGEQLGDDHHGCIRRPAHFPGIAFVGSFADDVGCEALGVLIDCQVGTIDPAALLARAGWTQARPAEREQIAMSYLREIALVFAGGVASEPRPPKVTTEKDGGVTIDLWTQDRSGMTPSVTRRRHVYRFSGAGTLTVKDLDVVTSDD